MSDSEGSGWEEASSLPPMGRVCTCDQRQREAREGFRLQSKLYYYYLSLSKKVAGLECQLDSAQVGKQWAVLIGIYRQMGV